MKKYDVIIVGAGASGLSAARSALANGRSVLVLDMGDKPARKVFVSGGGRCNITNMAASRDKYFGENPDFVRSAIANVKPTDILDWMREHNLTPVEKAAGQFFCESGSGDVVDALMADCNSADIIFGTTITDIEKTDDGFTVLSWDAEYHAASVIIATGGTSFPSLGVSDFGFMIAKKFGHKIIPIEPGLVGLKTDAFDTELSGISLDVEIKSGKQSVSDSLLFTHFGIGGPAAYRASMFDLNKDFHINFLPKTNVYDWLMTAKQTDGKKSLTTLLSQKLPSKFSRWIGGDANDNIADYNAKEITKIAKYINDFVFPGGSLKRRGMNSAEVVTGGVSTSDVSSKTMESKLCPGLFFVGEVLDIAGDLGGFNLHFAWASGITAGKYA